MLVTIVDVNDYVPEFPLPWTKDSLFYTLDLVEAWAHSLICYTDVPGTLIVTIIDVNDYAPEFPPPWTKDSPFYTLDLVEAQPAGTHLGTFTATDKDSNIAYYEIHPPSLYFTINNATGTYNVYHHL